MSQLVPCPSCSRHVRLSTSRCPFCESALDVAALGDQYAPRRIGIQVGAKRAVLFAMGATMAAACSEDNAQAIYGAPVPPTIEEPASSSTGDTQSRLDSRDEELPNQTNDVAIYGAPVPPASSGDRTSAASVAPSDAGEPGFDSGILDAAADAGADALTSTDDVTPGASDAAAFDASLVADTEPTSVALYGGPPLSN
jgi:hypothetical protein